MDEQEIMSFTIFTMVHHNVNQLKYSFVVQQREQYLRSDEQWLSVAFAPGAVVVFGYPIRMLDVEESHINDRVASFYSDAFFFMYCLLAIAMSIRTAMGRYFFCIQSVDSHE